MKQIDLSKSVYELVSEYPELADIMASLGFTEITKKLVLNSVGRMTTIPKGAKMKGIPMERILETFKEHGFEVAQSRTEMLKSYLQRLNNGESLEAVRDKQGQYVGTMEIVQDMEFARKHFAKP